MGKGGKVHIEKVGYLGRLQAIGLREAVPYPVEVLSEGSREVGKRCRANVISNDKQQQRFILVRVLRLGLCGLEETEVDLKHGLQETHVGALVQADLMFPQVDNHDLGRRHAEEGRLPLKVLQGGDGPGQHGFHALACARRVAHSPGLHLSPDRPYLRRP